MWIFSPKSQQESTSSYFSKCGAKYCSVCCCRCRPEPSLIADSQSKNVLTQCRYTFLSCACLSHPLGALQSFLHLSLLPPSPHPSLQLLYFCPCVLISLASVSLRSVFPRVLISLHTHSIFRRSVGISINLRKKVQYHHNILYLFN